MSLFESEWSLIPRLEQRQHHIYGANCEGRVCTKAAPATNHRISGLFTIIFLVWQFQPLLTKLQLNPLAAGLDFGSSASR